MQRYVDRSIALLHHSLLYRTAHHNPNQIPVKVLTMKILFWSFHISFSMIGGMTKCMHRLYSVIHAQTLILKNMSICIWSKLMQLKLLSVLVPPLNGEHEKPISLYTYFIFTFGTMHIKTCTEQLFTLNKIKLQKRHKHNIM